DAAALVISSVEVDSAGAARLMFTVGNHLVEDMAVVYGLKATSDPIIERGEYMVAVGRLRAAGYRVRDGETHWQQFAEMRSKYASMLNQVAQFLATPPAPWVGDRSYLPHRLRAARNRRQIRLRDGPHAGTWRLLPLVTGCMGTQVLFGTGMMRHIAGAPRGSAVR